MLAVLARYHVPGTFFVVGSRVAHYPQLARDIRAAGSEIGLHTFTHPELREVSPTRVDQEFTATQLALAGATGQLSYLVRPPYSSEADAVDDAGFAVMQQLGPEGYVTALVDTDSNDWQRPGVDAIVNAVLPVGATGGVVLLHDAGGDRSQTVAALDRIIPQLQAEGVRFTTVERRRRASRPPTSRPTPPSWPWARIMLGAVAVAGFDRGRAGVEPAARRRAGAAAPGADDGGGRPARPAQAAPGRRGTPATAGGRARCRSWCPAYNERDDHRGHGALAGWPATIRSR